VKANSQKQVKPQKCNAYKPLVKALLLLLIPVDVVGISAGRGTDT
jgi:hypothetical protein